MAKKKTEPEQPKEESAFEPQSIGSMMKTGRSQRDRNLEIKAMMVKNGEHPKPKFAAGATTKEKNLVLKAKLK